MAQIRYACEECGTVYKRVEDAEDCCPREPDEVTKRKCGHWVQVGIRDCSYCKYGWNQTVVED